MSEINSFKELQKEEEEQHEQHLLSVKKSIDGNLGVMSLFSEVLDVYFSKVINYVVNVSGGEENPSKNP